MHQNNKNLDELKRKLRSLKKVELRIRFGNEGLNIYNNIKCSDKKNGNINIIENNIDLVWDKFFDLSNNPGRNADKKTRYTLDKLVSMSKEELKNVIEEYFCYLYYSYCKERGISDNLITDIDLLDSLKMPLYSNNESVIKRLKELIKTYHPDNGGDVNHFLKIMEKYNKLKGDK